MAGRDLDIQAGITYPLTADVEGGALNLFPGYSTGFGRSFVSIKKAGIGLVSSSTLNTHVDGLIIGGFKTLTDGVAVTIVNATVINNSSAAFLIHYSVEVFNGTDLQIEYGSEIIAVYNKAGVYVTSVTDVKGPNIHSAGSLSVVWTATGTVDIKVNANSSLTPSAGFPRVNYSILNLGNQAITLL